MQILLGYSLGLSLFHTYYPFEQANAYKAFTFETNLGDDILALVKKEQSEEMDVTYYEKVEKHIDLSSDQFKKDFSPLKVNCTCYACKNHTRAYIHHLIICREMTANVLLTIHNLHIYESFFNDLKMIQKKGLK